MVIHHASITLNKTSTYFECKLRKKQQQTTTHFGSDASDYAQLPPTPCGEIKCSEQLVSE